MKLQAGHPVLVAALQVAAKFASHIRRIWSLSWLVPRSCLFVLQQIAGLHVLLPAQVQKVAGNARR